MKATEIISWLIGLFATAMGTWYGIWTEWQEPLGPTGLYFGAALGYMLGFYLHMTAKKHPGDPADNPLADVGDVSGDYGYFTPYSWWPLWLALAAALMFLGLAAGWWIVPIGAFLGIPALIGWVFEHYKGPNAN